MVEPAGSGMRIRLVAGRSILRLKSWMPSTNAQFVVAGVQLPTKVGAVAFAGDFRALCVGPDDLLLASSRQLSAPMRERIARDSLSQGIAVVDLTPGISVIELSGGARGILARSCSLDFEPQTSAHFQCARTRFAQLAVVIDLHKGGNAIDLYVARSHGAWLTGWLADATVGVS
jgi:heterotetrameric sarcosine oxidase gamma subunit